MSFLLVEKVAFEAAAATEDGVRRVRLISPGKGSSGFYTAEMLNQYIGEALPKGTLVYLDHTSESDKKERAGTRSIKDVAGKFMSDPVFEADAPEGAGSYADIKFYRTVSPLLEDVGDAIGVSIEVHAGKKDAKGNITEMHYHPLNSLALVPVPGRDGRIFEDFRAEASESQEDEGTDMQISEEDRKAIVTDVLAGLTEALKPEPVEETKPDVKALIEKVSKAGLPDVLIDGVIESVMDDGTDVDAAIKTAQDLVEAIRGKDKPADKKAPAAGLLSESAEDGPKDDAQRAKAYAERYFGGKK